jgi:hypothetical protein
MSEAMEANDLVVRHLVVALQDCYDTATTTGHNLPEMLREALEYLAVSYGSIEALVGQRPGSWEAGHVRQLAAGAEHLFDVALRNEAAALGHRITYDRDLAGSVTWRCSCHVTTTVDRGRPGRLPGLADDTTHIREVVEEHLRVSAERLGHVPLWSPGEPVSCSCRWPSAIEAGGATILDHFRRVIAPAAPSPGERAAELARRYGASPEGATS